MTDKCQTCGEPVRVVKAYVWSTCDEGGDWIDGFVLDRYPSLEGTFRLTGLVAPEAVQALPGVGLYRPHQCRGRQ